MQKTLFILGGTGFIGHETVTQAVQAGWQVKALVRSEEGAQRLRQAGAQPVLGNIYQPQAWIEEVRASVALILFEEVSLAIARSKRTISLADRNNK